MIDIPTGDCLMTATTTMRPWAGRIAVTIWVALLSGAWLMAARGAVGALGESMPAAVAWGIAVAMSLGGILASHLHMASRRGAPGDVASWSTDHLLDTLNLAPMVITTCVLVTPSQPNEWCGLLVLTVLTWSLRPGRFRRTVPSCSDLRTMPRQDNHEWTVGGRDTAGVPLRIDQAHVDEHFQLVLRRSRESGIDRLDGDVTVTWQPGQKHRSLHVAFVPVFEVKPDVSCSCATDDGIRGKVALVHPYGARIELRRSADCLEAAQTPVEIVAVSESSDRTAA